MGIKMVENKTLESIHVESIIDEFNRNRYKVTVTYIEPFSEMKSAFVHRVVSLCSPRYLTTLFSLLFGNGVGKEEILHCFDNFAPKSDSEAETKLEKIRSILGVDSNGKA